MSDSTQLIALWGLVCGLLGVAAAMRRLLVVQLPELGWWMLGLLLAVTGWAVQATGSGRGREGVFFAGWMLVASGIVMATHALQRRGSQEALLPLWIRVWFVGAVGLEALYAGLVALPSEGSRGVANGVWALMLVPGFWTAVRGSRLTGSVALALLAGVWGVTAVLLAASMGGVAFGFFGAPGAGLTLGLSSLLFSWACIERAVGQADRWASHDPLTGCINRPTARTLLDHALLRARRERQSVGLLALDLDHFRRVNLRFGNASADLVLQCFVDAVRLRLRASDVFCRWDGDHFNVMLPATDAAGARRLAEDICAAVSRLRVRTPRHAEIGLSVSIGVAVAIADSESSAEDLIARAENALARAKQAGRNRVEQACVEMALVAG